MYFKNNLGSKQDDPPFGPETEQIHKTRSRTEASESRSSCIFPMGQWRQKVKDLENQETAKPDSLLKAEDEAGAERKLKNTSASLRIELRFKQCSEL